MSDDMGEPDIQRFDRDGTWVKPPGAVRLDVSLKGGVDGNSVGALPRALTFFGPGGGAAFGHQGGGSGGSAACGIEGGAGAGGGWSTAAPVDPGAMARAPEWNVLPGDEGQLVDFSFAADEVPDRMDITIGRGGYAVITTHLEVQ